MDVQKRKQRGLMFGGAVSPYLLLQFFNIKVKMHAQAISETINTNTQELTVLYNELASLRKKLEPTELIF